MKKYSFFTLMAALIPALLISCSFGKESDGFIPLEKAAHYRIDYKSFIDKSSPNVIKLGFVGNPDSFNPFRSKKDGEIFLKRALFSSLFYFDTTTGRVEKNLLLDYSVSESGLSYNFILKKALKFSDGEPLTSDDIIASLELYNRGLTYSPYMQNRKLELTRVKDSQFLIHLERADSNLLYFLTEYPIIKAEKAAKLNSIEDYITLMGPRAKDVVGSGPYRLASYSGKEAILEKNRYYFKSQGEDNLPLPYSESLKLYFYENYEAMVLSFTEGEIDCLPGKEEDYRVLVDYFKSGSKVKVKFIEKGFSREKIVTLYNLFSADSKPYLHNIEVRTELNTVLSLISTPGYKTSSSLLKIKEIKESSNDKISSQQSPYYFKLIMPDNNLMRPIKGELEEILQNSTMLFEVEMLPYNQFIEELVINKSYDIALFDYNFDFYPLSYTNLYRDREEFFSPYFGSGKSFGELRESLNQILRSPIENHQSELEKVDELFQKNIQLTPSIWLKEYYILKDDIYNFKMNNSLYKGYDLNTIERMLKLHED